MQGPATSSNDFEGTDDKAETIRLSTLLEKVGVPAA